MGERRASGRARSTRVLVATLALGMLTGCSTSTGPHDRERSEATNRAGTTDPAVPDASTAQVRGTLGALDPCALLTPSGADRVRRPYAEGPHTCEGQLDGARVRVEVGVPFDDASRAAAEPQEIAGLTAYADPDRCRVVFGVGPSHGIAVEVDGRCDVLPQAGDIVGAALATDVDGRVRPSGPDDHSACGLLTTAVDDPGALVDAVGDMSQGLDYCEVATDPPLSATGLRLDYSETGFDELARLLGGERVMIGGLGAVLVRGEGVCYLHTYLWSTHAEGRGSVQTEAVVTARTCTAARSAASAVVAAADREPDVAGSVAELLTRAG